MKQPLGEWGEQEHEAGIADRLDRMRVQRKKEKLILNGLGVLIGGLAVFLCLRWFDWRLLVVIFVALFGNNLSQIK